MTEPIENALAQSLEAIEKGGKSPSDCLAQYPEIHSELESLLSLAISLRDTADLKPDPEFRAKLRQKILDRVQEHSHALVGSRNMRALRSIINTILMRPMIRLALAVFLIAVLLTGGVIYVSAQSLPGDLLYPVKNIIEGIRLNIQGESAEPDLHMEYAEKRLKEVQGLIEEGRYEYIPSAVGSYITNVDVATGSLLDDEAKYKDKFEAKSAELDYNLAQHIEILTGLLDKLPPQAIPDILHAIEASSKGKEKLKERFPDGIPGAGQRPEPSDQDGSDQKPESPPGQEEQKPDPPGPPEGVGPPTQANPQQESSQSEPPQGTPGPPPKDD